MPDIYIYSEKMYYISLAMSTALESENLNYNILFCNILIICIN